MNRKLVLIFSDGGEDALLNGVHIDRDNYLNFFKSPEGGAWEDNEILLYDNNNFYVELLQVINLNAILSKKPIEFFLIVYCGHGFTDQYGDIHFHVRKNCNLKLDDLLKVVEQTRCMVIADCCRAVYRLNEGGEIGDMCLFSTSEDARKSVYADLCRKAYNEYLAATPSTMLMVLFSNSFGETADENGAGGLYSYALLNAAKAEINRMQECQQHLAKSRMVDADTIHNIAKMEVERKTNQQQHPDKVKDTESPARFPFVVVPHWPLQIPCDD